MSSLLCYMKEEARENLSPTQQDSANKIRGKKVSCLKKIYGTKSFLNSLYGTTAIKVAESFKSTVLRPVFLMRRRIKG